MQISLTFGNSCVGHDPSTIDVAPASAAADARRAADVLHLEPEAREAHRPHRNLRGSRCLLKEGKPVYILLVQISAINLR